MGAGGRIVILNGAPRSGKSSIVAAIQESFDGAWHNLGVDRAMRTTPAELLPGIGLRPGGERPDLEEYVQQQFAALYESVAALCEQGGNVVVDVGHHDSYTRSLGTLRAAAERLEGLPAWLIGVMCPLDVVMHRRDSDSDAGYLGTTDQGTVQEQVRRWQIEVHRPGIYDAVVVASELTPNACAEAIAHRLLTAPTALSRIANATTA